MKMFSTASIIVRLATLFLFLGSNASGATIESVRLVGDSNNYISIQSKKPYTLSCTYRSGYDDPVTSVNWYKMGQLVYIWKEGETVSTAYRDLSGKVALSGSIPLKDLNFNNNVSFDLSGNYSCEVVSKKERAMSDPYPLVVLDMPSDEFLSNVTLLSDSPEEEEEKEATLLERGGNCTLLWDFRTPAIFPRPNVTCGYYSYLHDDVTNPLPSGLTMHLLNNGSWQAGFEHIHIQVSEIPREKRLGCSVSVPNTSFKKVIKFEDNFAIDHMIDSQGCPSMFLDPLYRLRFRIEGGAINCRGDLVPESEQEPLNIKFGCPDDEYAMFPNGTVVASWSTEMTCDPMDLIWRRVEEGEMSQPVTNIENEVPMCLPSKGCQLGSSSGSLGAFILLGVIFSLGRSTQL